MESMTPVFCDWTLPDAAGRFIMFSLWGYYMGKSVTNPAKTKWVLTFGGVLACALIHTWMQVGELQQYEMYPAGVSDSEGRELIYYFIKVFLFYLTASSLGFSAGQQTAKRIRADLNRVQATLNRWENRSVKKDDTKQAGV
ncbi:MAG: hypothetical protein MI863_06645 [Desulfobacterales bacterium]|nr:hypothetical protein [Desulfobacterales bacterium]